jgi:hypothetical protein
MRPAESALATGTPLRNLPFRAPAPAYNPAKRTSMKSRTPITLTLTLAAAALAILAPAQPAAKPADAVPSNHELAAITQRGTMLAAYDQAAWHATDAVQLTHPPAGKVVRYIARQTANGWTVDFGRLSPDGAKFLTAYEAVQTSDPAHFAVSQFDPEREDTGFNLFAARAIDLALKNFSPPASHAYNIAVLPGGANGNLVYVYPAQTKDGVYPYGGDARFFASPDGLTLYEKRQLHKTILESIPAQLPQGTTPAAGYHTHVLTTVPEDTDVFLVLSRQPRIPEYITAGAHVYKIDIDGTIHVDPTDAPPPTH